MLIYTQPSSRHQITVYDYDYLKVALLMFILLSYDIGWVNINGIQTPHNHKDCQPRDRSLL